MSNLRTYRPRRASSRWLDGDCPRGVLAIFDNGGLEKRNGSMDRYTVFYAEPLRSRRHAARRYARARRPTAQSHLGPARFPA